MRTPLRFAPVMLAALSLVALLVPRGAETVPLFAARTGLPCRTCHFDPNGGGPRNEFGFAYAKNRHEITPEGPESPWADLALVNRVGDAMPVYLGLNQRFMLLANSTVTSDSLDRAGFVSMENALHITFQPHDRLTLSYTRDVDGFSGQVGLAREAYGMFGGLPADGYVKAGRIRPVFGLRMDDHTVATRNSFLDFQSGERFLPYDPRRVDAGLEAGVTPGDWFGRVQWLNGDANVFQGQYAGATSAKLGYNVAAYQGAVSFYDDYRKETFSGTRRATRWGYYGMTRWNRFALLGEIAAGTDEFVSGDKRNRRGMWAELDWTPNRWSNWRVRYDYLQLDRSSDPDVRERSTFFRYALEGEFLPVPFGEIRWVFRLIDPKAETDAFDNEIPNEKQAYVQFHFSY